MNDEGSLGPYCVIGCQVHKTGFWLSSIALKPHDSPFKWGKRGKRGVKKKKKLDCAADHVSSSTLVRFVPRFYHLLMKPSHTVFTQRS